MVVAGLIHQCKAMGLCACSLKAHIYVLCLLNSLLFQKCDSFSFRRTTLKRDGNNNDLENLLLLNAYASDGSSSEYNLNNRKDIAREYLNLIKTIVNDEKENAFLTKQSNLDESSVDLPEVLSIDNNDSEITIPTDSLRPSDDNIAPLYTRLLRVVLEEEEDVGQQGTSAFDRSSRQKRIPNMPGMLGFDIMSKTTNILNRENERQQALTLTKPVLPNFAPSNRQRPPVFPGLNQGPGKPKLSVSENMESLLKLMEVMRDRG